MRVPASYPQPPAFGAFANVPLPLLDLASLAGRARSTTNRLTGLARASLSIPAEVSQRATAEGPARGRDRASLAGMGATG